MNNDRPIPLVDNVRCRMLLDQLRKGPRSTVELQRSLPLIHVARQVWELRHWYGYQIKTRRLPSRVAVYTLLPSPDATPDGPVNRFHGREALGVERFFDR